MIGIIGGIGPAAGLNLAKLMTEQVAVSKDQDHIPWMLMNQPGEILDRTEYLMGQVDQNPGLAIAAQLLTLEKAGCTLAGIACNTAHAPRIFDCILVELTKNNSRIKLLHAIEEMTRHAQEQLPEGAKIGILGTTGSYLNKIHATPLLRAGFELIDPGIDRQTDDIHQAIYHPEWGIKASAHPTGECLEHLQQAIDFYRQQEAHCLLLGCSEISLVIDSLDTRGLTQLRPMTILARSLVNAYQLSRGLAASG